MLLKRARVLWFVVSTLIFADSKPNGNREEETYRGDTEGLTETVDRSSADDGGTDVEKAVTEKDK